MPHSREVTDAFLFTDRVSVSYGPVTALREASVTVAHGELIAVLGANGAGKSTLLQAMAGLHPTSSGEIYLEGTEITADGSHDRVRRGIVYVPEGRHLFPWLSVEENLRLGSWGKALRPTLEDRLAGVLEAIPILADRRNQLAHSLSGGEQQMLAIGRALMGRPRLLLLDEPSLGLSPLWVEEVYALISSILKDGTTIVLVEQNVPLALRLSSYGYVLSSGRCVREGVAEELAADDEVRRAYMGL